MVQKGLRIRLGRAHMLVVTPGKIALYLGMAVLAGRKVLPHIGVVDNQDIVDLIHAYPGRFTGMAGVDPSDGPEAMEELEQLKNALKELADSPKAKTE